MGTAAFGANREFSRGIRETSLLIRTRNRVGFKTDDLLPSALAVKTRAGFAARPSSVASGVSIFSRLDQEADVRRGWPPRCRERGRHTLESGLRAARQSQPFAQ